MSSSNEDFSNFLENIKKIPWSLLSTELSELKSKVMLSVFDAKSTPINLKKIQSIERRLLESSEGLITLSNELKSYPGIDAEIQKQCANAKQVATQQGHAKQADVKNTESSGWYSTFTSFFSSTATTLYTNGQYYLGYKTNVEFAARAKIIVDEAISDNKEEDTKGSGHSLAFQKTLEALFKLSEVYNSVPTDGSIKKSIRKTLSDYGFPTENKALSDQLLRKYKEFEMVQQPNSFSPRSSGPK